MNFLAWLVTMSHNGSYSSGSQGGEKLSDVFACLYIYIYGLFVVACGLLCCSAHALELEGSVVAAYRHAPWHVGS